MGRKSEFTQAIADSICESIANGMSLRTICKADDMPAMSTVFKWLNDIDGFSEQYARAKEEQAETLADEIVDIADESMNDVIVDKDGNERVNNEVVARARLRIDARKWVASKLKPKKYGDKLDVAANHTGSITLTLSNDDAEL